MKHYRNLISPTLLLLVLTATAAFAGGPDDPAQLANPLGISFPNGTSSTLILERDGKRYLIDVAAKTVQEVAPGASEPAAALFQQNCAACHGPGGKGLAAVHTPDFTNPAFERSLSDQDITAAIRNGKARGRMPAWSGKLTDAQIDSLSTYIRSFSNTGGAGGVSASSGQTQESGRTTSNVYAPADDLLFSLPTGRPVDEHGLYVNFTHRFPYDAAFTGPGRGGELFGLDNFALASFGLRYGVSDKLSVSIFRSPTLIGRPIQLMAAYNILDEHHEAPLNMTVRVSIEGQNNFSKNYTQNIEGIFSRSITSRAQVYVVPTLSFDARPLVQATGFQSADIPDLPGVDTFSIGVGAAYDIRPTVALIAEVIPTLWNASELGIHRPAYSFGIQKKIFRHAFTLGLTTSPGVTVSQRAGTRAEFLGEPSADTPGGLFFGFDLMRQIH
jgi:mono/diheme cytochrome c family protein